MVLLLSFKKIEKQVFCLIEQQSAYSGPSLYKNDSMGLCRALSLAQTYSNEAWLRSVLLCVSKITRITRV